MAVKRNLDQHSSEDVIVEAAWLYYEEGLNQNEIAQRLSVSRATVVNYLQEARERSYVQISLSPKVFASHQLAHDLKGKFGLADVIVLPDDAGEENTAWRVARGAARLVPSLLNAGDRLGIAWGKTIYDVAEHLEHKVVDNLTVLQLVGSMATPYGFSADVCSSRFARKLSARCINLHVPAILSSKKIANLLQEEELIAHQLNEITSFNKTVFAVGSCMPDSHVVSSGVATREELQIYVDRGAIGVLCGRFIDKNGNGISGPLDGRILGISAEKMRNPEVGILVSTGKERVRPTLAALNGGYVTHLVTSAHFAGELLSLSD